LEELRVVENLQIISLTHRNAPLELIGKLHIDEEKRPEVLRELVSKLGLKELVYLSTCNRVEFIISDESYFCKGREHQLLEHLGVSGKNKAEILARFKATRGELAVRHLFEVGASLDSMVLGEREIITQVRKSFEDAQQWGTGGDLMRLINKKVVETAKRIYTETAIATRPVSVVSLAWNRFKQKGFALDTPILLIGAGQTNGNFARFLAKTGYTNVTIANRTLERAIELATPNNWKAVQLFHIPARHNFSVVVTCTGSEDPIVTKDFLSGVVAKNLFLIDMAVPADVAENVQRMSGVEYLGMPHLQKEAETNLAVRKGEIARCTVIIDEAMNEFRKVLRQREIELAMREIPELIKSIKTTAMGEVFAKELDQLDEQSLALLEKIIGYMEKKYISVPMKLAREVMLEKAGRN
jgi:glutamyl-tRNA reductase